MRKFIHLCLIITLAAFHLHSCKKDDSPGLPPEGESLTESIEASPGDAIKFEGTFTTENNFSKILLFNEALMLDKEIVFANSVSKYYLDYSFTIPEETPFNTYDVKITAQTSDGASQEFTVTVKVSSVPEASGLSTSIAAIPGEDISFTGTITDAQGLKSITIQSSSIELDETIDLTDNPTEYSLNYTYSVPSTASQTVHQGQIVVTNISDRSVTYNLEINLSGEEVTYNEMYAAGGIQWWTWNAEHAYMMLPDASSANWFEITVPAWPEEGYNELKFLGQLAWEPNNWGLIDNTNPDAGMLNADASMPILLDAASSSYYPAYFNVRFNPVSMEYSAEEVDQSGFAAQDAMYIVGAGFTDYPNLNWNPEEAIPMVKNPDGYGEHIFAIYGLNFSDSVSLKFIGQNDGWSPVDVGFDTDYIEDADDSEDGYQVVEPVSWVPTKSGDGTADLKFYSQAGSYTVLYDHFAKRAIIWKEE